MDGIVFGSDQWVSSLPYQQMNNKHEINVQLVHQYRRMCMMQENPIPESQTEKKSNAGCLGEVGWLLSGAVLPLGSFAYYRKAAQKSVGSAILFFIIFTLVISVLSTISLGVTIFSAIQGIQQAYAAGDVPEVTISHSVAEVNGTQPFILFDGADANGQSILVALDTTGEITEIDSRRFDQGLLLTRTELHILNRQNGYQVLPLSELHTLFARDPIIINAQTVSQAWGVMSMIIVALAFIFLVLWHTVARLMVISIIALILWGIVSLIRPNTGFGPIIISGLYAIVPAIYLSHLFSRSGLGLPGLQTFFLLLFWVIGLVVNFADLKFFNEDRPVRLWTALIGLPMLLLYVVDLFWQFPSPYGPIALWVVTLLTGLVLVGSRLYFRSKDQKPEGSLA